MLFGDFQTEASKLFWGAAATVAFWIWAIRKIGLGGHAKKEASGWLARVITGLFK
jgi:hypothetical protein